MAAVVATRAAPTSALTHEAPGDARRKGAAASNPLSNPNFLTRNSAHVLLSEVSRAPWLLDCRLLTGRQQDEAMQSIVTHGFLAAPELVRPDVADACLRDADAAVQRVCKLPLHDAEPLLNRAREPQYGSVDVKLDVTPAASALLMSIRHSRLAPVIAARLGVDAVLCELSCVRADPGARAQHAHCNTPARESEARTEHQRMLARHNTSVLSVHVALSDTDYAMGPTLLWPQTHTAAFHGDARDRGMAAALRDQMGVHLDLAAGDAVLVDSRLWLCHGSNATARTNGTWRRRAVVIASFCSARLFPPQDTYSLLPRLLGRFSLLNLEAALTSGEWHAPPLADAPMAAEDNCRPAASAACAAVDQRCVYVPRAMTDELLALVRAMSDDLSGEVPLARRCIDALLHAIVAHERSVRRGSDAPAPPACATGREHVRSSSAVSAVLLGRAASATSLRLALCVRGGADGGPATTRAAEPRAAGMVRVPPACLRAILMLRAIERPSALDAHITGLLRAEEAEFRKQGGVPAHAVPQEELRARWRDAHTRYKTDLSALQSHREAERFVCVLTAAGKGDEDTCRVWLEGGGSVNARGGNGAVTMLMKACANGRLTLVDALLRSGASVNLKDDEGSTALHAAAFMGNEAIVRALLKAGANPDICDRDGDSALLWAAERGHVKVAELLQGQSFEPIILRALLDPADVGLLLKLRDSSCPVHDDGSGHEVLFLHAAQAAGHLSDEYVALFGRLAETMRAKDPRRGDLGDDLRVRCVELHTYGVGGALMDRDHKDSGSALTMSMLLSKAADVDGGKFLTWADAGTPIVHDLDSGQGILFRSEDYHNVSPVTRGVRHALVIELWAGATNCYDRNR